MRGAAVQEMKPTGAKQITTMRGGVIREQAYSVG